jgi:hypothetical protein
VIKVDRELRPLVIAAIEQGWEVTKTGGGHSDVEGLAPREVRDGEV